MLHKEIIRFKSGVYKITCMQNNKVYIGGSKNIYNRYHTHQTKLSQNIHNCKDLQLDYLKYGRNEFILEVLEYCDLEEITIKEQYYNDLFELEVKYNKREFVETNKNLVISEDLKQRISNTLKEKNKKLEALGLPKLNPQNLDKWKPIIMYDLEGNFLKEFTSINKASKELIDSDNLVSCIGKICKERKGRYTNYQFRYKSDNLEKISNHINTHSRIVILKNILNNKIEKFNSLKEVSDFFGVKGINSSINRGKYKEWIVIPSPDKIGLKLENPEVDNQLPTIQSQNSSIEVQRLDNSNDIQIIQEIPTISSPLIDDIV